MSKNSHRKFPALFMRDVAFNYENSEQSSAPRPMIFNLEIPQGKKVAIVGPSGSGKSTLLKLISGEKAAHGGALSVMGRDLRSMSTEQLSEFRLHEISQVFQELELLPQLSSLENVSLQLELRGESRKLAKNRASEALVKLGLESKLRKKPSQLSGGERQRVAIARALITKSPLYLADEPTAALDKEAKKNVVDLLFIATEGSTFIASTHDDYLMSRCDVVLDLADIVSR